MIAFVRENETYANQMPYRTDAGYRAVQEIWSSTDGFSLGSGMLRLDVEFFRMDTLKSWDKKAQWWRNGFELIWEVVREGATIYKKVRDELGTIVYKKQTQSPSIWREQK